MACLPFEGEGAMRCLPPVTFIWDNLSNRPTRDQLVGIFPNGDWPPKDYGRIFLIMSGISHSG